MGQAGPPGFDDAGGGGERGGSGALPSTRCAGRHNPKGCLIILNGVGSAGKSSIAKALQQIIPTPWLLIEMDKFCEGRLERHQDSNASPMKRKRRTASPS